MTLKYIRETYKVPANRGERVVIFSGQKGTIKSARGGHLMILVDGQKIAKPFHPTWNIDYFSNCPWLGEEEKKEL